MIVIAFLKFVRDIYVASHLVWLERGGGGEEGEGEKSLIDRGLLSIQDQC